MLKVKILFIIIVIPTLILTGCTQKILPSRVEINDLMMISAAGIDKGMENPDNICITIVSKKPNEAQGGKPAGGEDAQESMILSKEDKTLIDATKQFQTTSDKQIFWGHVEYYIIGEEAAKEGIAKYIDFLSRDHEIRGNSKIYIAEGTTAKEFIEKTSTGSSFMPDHLKSIGKNSKLVTGAQELKLFEFMQWLNNKYSSAVIPMLCLKEKKEEKTQSEQSAMELDLCGYGIVKDLKLITKLDKQMTRGENFLLNRVISGVVQVPDTEGNMVGLEIIDSNTKIEPKFEKDELKQINIKVKVSSNVDEVHSTSSIFQKDSLRFIANEQSKVIKDEIEKVIAHAKENNSDFIDISSILETKHPVKWVKIRDKWDSIFPELPITVDVESSIKRTYDIREPNGFFKEEDS